MPQTKDKSPGSHRAWLATLAGVLAVAVLLAWAVLNARQGDRQAQGLFLNTLKKGDVVAAMRIDLLKAVEAEKSAVLADTDQASQEYADMARQATQAVEDRRQEFQKLLQAEPSPEEGKLAEEFARAWSEFRKVDQEILQLAVQNTNLKAASLSQGQVRQALDSLEQALERLRAREAQSPQAVRINNLACRALTAGLKALSLQAPHINEASDQGMDRLEAEMAAQEETLRQALASLEALISPAARPDLDAARQACQRFSELSREVVKLSRQNSNVKSLELSLGQKRRVAAQCQEILGALREAIQSRGFKATR